MQIITILVTDFAESNGYSIVVGLVGIGYQILCSFSLAERITIPKHAKLIIENFFYFDEIPQGDYFQQRSIICGEIVGGYLGCLGMYLKLGTTFHP